MPAAADSTGASVRGGVSVLSAAAQAAVALLVLIGLTVGSWGGTAWAEDPAPNLETWGDDYWTYTLVDYGPALMEVEIETHTGSGIEGAFEIGYCADDTGKVYVDRTVSWGGASSGSTTRSMGECDDDPIGHPDDEWQGTPHRVGYMSVESGEHTGSPYFKPSGDQGWHFCVGQCEAQSEWEEPLGSFDNYCPDDLIADAHAGWDDEESLLTVLVEVDEGYRRAWTEEEWEAEGIDPETVHGDFVSDEPRYFGHGASGQVYWRGRLADPRRVAAEGPLDWSEHHHFVHVGMDHQPYGSWEFGIYLRAWDTDPGWHETGNGRWYVGVDLGGPFAARCYFEVDLTDEAESPPRHPSREHDGDSPEMLDDPPEGEGDEDFEDDGECGFSWTSPTSWVRCLLVPSHDTRHALGELGEDVAETVPLGWVTGIVEWLEPLTSDGVCNPTDRPDTCNTRLSVQLGALPGVSEGDEWVLLDSETGVTQNEDGEWISCTSATTEFTCGTRSAHFLARFRPFFGLVTYGLVFAAVFITVRRMSNPTGAG